MGNPMCGLRFQKELWNREICNFKGIGCCLLFRLSSFKPLWSNWASLMKNYIFQEIIFHTYMATHIYRSKDIWKKNYINGRIEWVLRDDNWLVELSYYRQLTFSHRKWKCKIYFKTLWNKVISPLEVVCQEVMIWVECLAVVSVPYIVTVCYLF